VGVRDEIREQPDVLARLVERGRTPGEAAGLVAVRPPINP